MEHFLRKGFLLILGFGFVLLLLKVCGLFHFWTTFCTEHWQAQPGLPAMNADVLGLVSAPHIAMESHVLPGHTYSIQMVADG